MIVRGASSPGFLDERLQTAGAAALLSDASSLSGRRIGTYSVHERIGAGGMGEVHRAHDSKLRRDVVQGAGYSWDLAPCCGGQTGNDETPYVIGQDSTV